MNKITLKVMMAVYAGSFLAGFIYAFSTELQKQKMEIKHTPSIEFQNLVNHYNNKQKEKVS